jgi:uncharacterized protein (DUF433 family)
MKPIAITSLLALLLLPLSPLFAAEPGGNFIIRDTNRSTETVLEAIQGYVAEQDDWLYLADFPLKGGDVTAVKVCYLPIGPDLFAAGMHVAAMLPCGHIALYEEDGKTRLAMLHPRFLHVLYPDPNLERAASRAVPAFDAMLEAIWD